MPKQMSGKTFSNLLDYYIACLEQEDMLSVTFNVSAEGTRFVSAPFHTEELFHTNNKQVTVESSEEIQRFFQTSLLQQKQKTLFYGYPVLIGPEGIISPVFFMELQFVQQGNELMLSTITPERKLNHHVLSLYGFSSEEIINIQREIETEEFPAALSSICDLLHADSTGLSPALEKAPLKRTISLKLVNRAMLYFGERTDITFNLIAELRQLKKKPLDDLASTALLLIITEEFLTRMTTETTPSLLEIFSLNPSQNSAVHKALTQPLTVITGPPGTGKSQVVLNIIANAVYQNKTVLFASRNNKAVDVVIEKLNAILPYKLIVRMGNRNHRRNTKSELEHLITQHFSIKILPEKTRIEGQDTAMKIEHLQSQLTTMVALNESIQHARDTLESLRERLPAEVVFDENLLQLHNIDSYVLEKDLKKNFSHHGILQHLNPRRFQKNQERCFHTYYDVLPSSLKKKLQNMLSNKKATPELILDVVLTLKKMELVFEEIRNLKKRLHTFPSYTSLKQKLAELHERHVLCSRPILESYWMEKMVEKTAENKRCITSYFSASEQLESYVGDPIVFKQLSSEQVRTFQRILSFLPVWVVTNLSAKQSFPLKNNLFDILIIDEASQCDIASALPLFYRAKQVVIIGDPHQLSHISLLTETQDRALVATAHLAEEWFTKFSYTQHSLYDFAERITRRNREEPVLLNEHYRCHSDIISFSNDYYYGRKLTIATDETRLLHHPSITTRILWHHVKGRTMHTKSPYNEQEAEKVVEEILKILGMTPPLAASVGVVTLFRAQTEIIAQKLQMFQDIYDTNIVIGTAHRFQGDEKDIIVFSPAVSDEVKPGTLHWIQTTNQLLNVAVTRARSLFIIVGDHEVCLHTSGPLKQLAEYTDTIVRQNIGFDAPHKQRFYEELQKHGIFVITHYEITGNPPLLIDFALFVNGSRYAILIDDDFMDTNLKHLRAEGWKIGRFHKKDVDERCTDILEEIARLC
jgi:superfamily I DNA and/or RNA helicase